MNTIDNCKHTVTISLNFHTGELKGLLCPHSSVGHMDCVQWFCAVVNDSALSMISALWFMIIHYGQWFRNVVNDSALCKWFYMWSMNLECGQWFCTVVNESGSLSMNLHCVSVSAFRSMILHHGQWIWAVVNDSSLWSMNLNCGHINLDLWSMQGRRRLPQCKLNQNYSTMSDSKL
jgi:hypothetical protein